MLFNSACKNGKGEGSSAKYVADVILLVPEIYGMVN